MQNKKLILLIVVLMPFFWLSFVSAFPPTPINKTSVLPCTTGSDNELMTDNGSGGLNSESNLTFDGNTLDVSGDIVTERSTTPAVVFRDSDCTDSHANAQVYINATDTGSGTEDVDLFIQTQINGIMTNIINFDASENKFRGSYTFGTVEGDMTMADFPATINIASFEYKDADEITIGEGSYWICNGDYSHVTSDTDVAISSASGPDFYYLYDDDSERSGDTPVFLFGTIEPVKTEDFSSGKVGWYNGDDRCVGAVWVESGNTIADFQATVTGDIVYFLYYDTPNVLASDMGPDSTWQTPGDDTGATYSPVNATHLFVSFEGSDSGAAVYVGVASAETAGFGWPIQLSPLYTYAVTDFTRATGWCPLGASREIRLYSQDADDDDLSADTLGFAYSLK